MKIKRLLFIIPLIIMVWIFLLSAQNGQASLNLSDGLVYKLTSEFCRIFNLKNIDIYNITEVLRTLVRKAAHFSIYGLLGISFIISIYFNFLSLKRKHLFIISQFLSSFYAVTDEFHQLSVQGRSGNFYDIIIDSIGAFCGITLVYFIIFRKNKLN